MLAKAVERHVYNNKLYSSEVSEQKRKELIDDFDHIAFNHLIIAYEFLNEIEISTNSEVRTFYFHEILYYLRTSVNIAKEITHPDRRKSCLNIFGNVNGVDIFRLMNAHKMMRDLLDKSKEILDNIDYLNKIQIYDVELKNALSFQIEELNRDIIEVGKRCEQAIADIKPTN